MYIWWEEHHIREECNKLSIKLRKFYLVCLGACEPLSMSAKGIFDCQSANSAATTNPNNFLSSVHMETRNYYKERTHVHMNSKMPIPIHISMKEIQLSYFVQRYFMLIKKSILISKIHSSTWYPSRSINLKLTYNEYLNNFIACPIFS